VRLNRAVAVVEIDGPEAALAIVEALRGPDVEGYYLFQAIRADLLQRVGRTADAAQVYEATIERTANACERAFPAPPPFGKRHDETRAEWRARLTEEQRQQLKAWRDGHSFHPYQLRHTAATTIRRECGLEAAQLALGHASAHVTDAIYAERDEAKIAEAVRRVG